MSDIYKKRSQEATQYTNQFSLPSYPHVLQEIDKELSKKEPDLSQIGALIATDPNMSQIILRVINSALYGLRNQVTSIHNAVSLLGLDKIKIVIYLPTLKKSLGIENELTKYLWKRTALVALCSSKLATYVEGVEKDDAYTAGLFHNSGCLIFNNQYHDYESIFINGYDKSVPIYELESSQYGMSHIIASFLLSQKWALSEEINATILLQHEKEYSSIEESPIRALIAILILSNGMVDDILMETEDVYNWGFQQYHQNAIEELAIDQDFFEDFSSEIKADIRDERDDLLII